MKNIMKRANDFINEKAIKAKTFMRVQATKMYAPLANNRGSGYVDTAIVILISVVVGGLLLVGLYALFGDVVMPTLKTKIQEMFNYKG